MTASEACAIRVHARVISLLHLGYKLRLYFVFVILMQKMQNFVDVLFRCYRMTTSKQQTKEGNKMEHVEYFGMTYLAEVTGQEQLKAVRALQFFGGNGAACIEVLVRPCVLHFVKPKKDGGGNWVMENGAIAVEPDGIKSGIYWVAQNGRVFAESDFNAPDFEESAF